MMGDISTLGALEDRLCSALASTSIDGGKAQALPSAMAIRIVHVDLDAFFVEVCRQRYPELRDVELLVVGGRRDQRGVVQSASYAARKAGVRSGMPIAEAVRRCPGATFFQGDFRYYRDASRAVAAILHDFSPTVVMASLDEAYLDFTGTERQHPVSLLPEAARMKDRIRAETGLACSVGIGTNRMIAKLASDYAKPRGLMEVRAGWEAGFLAGLPLAALPGVGPRTAERWRELGLTGVAQVQAMSEAALIRLLGKDAVLLRRRAFGQGGTTLTADRLPRSVSRETTLSRDERDAKRLEGLLLLLTARVAAQLREEQLMGRTVTLKLRHDDFITVTRRHTLPEPTNLDQELASAAQTLFRKAFAEVRGRDRGVRLIGVAVTGITPVESLDLFEPPARTRLRQLTAAVDAVREKFGFEAVTPGRLVEFKRGRKA
ncbi:MAG TPA: DNA polymerase IV [Gemmatimonadales bacterium]|jgi:DNA polymerase-4|nr:DNA polymerase IV [Gemmatimonadales bacterium]